MKTTTRFSYALLCGACLFYGASVTAQETPAPATDATPAAAAETALPVTPTSTDVSATPAPAKAFTGTVAQWEVLPDKSSIEWAAVYSGKTITGAFKTFSSSIAFDPDHLDQSSVNVTIDVAKITSDDKDAEAALPGAEWFDTAKNPQATFVAKVFRHLEDEKYEADGTLTIGSQHAQITLPFTAHFYDDNETAPPARYAQITAETMIKRNDYGVGKGDWTKTDVVADEVKITINLKAKTAAQPAATTTTP